MACSSFGGEDKFRRNKEQRRSEEEESHQWWRRDYQGDSINLWISATSVSVGGVDRSYPRSSPPSCRSWESELWCYLISDEEERMGSLTLTENWMLPERELGSRRKGWTAATDRASVTLFHLFIFSCILMPCSISFPYHLSLHLQLLFTRSAISCYHHLWLPPSPVTAIYCYRLHMFSIRREKPL